MDVELTLAELAQLVEMQPRTIRSYIEQGLLRGPDTGGRGARYTNYHVERLRAIRALKDVRGLPLSEVRRRLMLLPAGEIAALAEDRSTTTALCSAAPSPPDSALAYLRGLKGPETESVRLHAFAAAAEESGPSPMDVLLTRLDRLAGSRKPARKARSEVWTAIEVTPDVELRIRGELSADDRNRWERVADYLREELLHPSTQSTKED